MNISIILSAILEKGVIMSVLLSAVVEKFINMSVTLPTAVEKYVFGLVCCFTSQSTAKSRQYGQFT